MLWHPALLVRNLNARRRVLRRMPAALDMFAESLSSLVAACRPAFIVFDPFLLVYYPTFARSRSRWWC